MQNNHISPERMAEVYYGRLNFFSMAVVSTLMKSFDSKSMTASYWNQVLEFIKAKVEERKNGKHQLAARDDA